MFERDGRGWVGGGWGPGVVWCGVVWRGYEVGVAGEGGTSTGGGYGWRGHFVPCRWCHNPCQYLNAAGLQRRGPLDGEHIVTGGTLQALQGSHSLAAVHAVVLTRKRSISYFFLSLTAEGKVASLNAYRCVPGNGSLMDLRGQYIGYFSGAYCTCLNDCGVLCNI